MEFRYHDGEETHVVRIVERQGGFEAQIGERRYRVQAQGIDESTLSLWLDGRFHRVRHAAAGDDRWVALDGAIHHVTRISQRRDYRGTGAGEDTLTAEMPGQIVAVQVAAGDQVERGDVLVVMEAMKMELRVVAPHAGTVEKVLVSAGEAVDRGQTLVEMQGAE